MKSFFQGMMVMALIASVALNVAQWKGVFSETGYTVEQREAMNALAAME